MPSPRPLMGLPSPHGPPSLRVLPIGSYACSTLSCPYTEEERLLTPRRPPAATSLSLPSFEVLSHFRWALPVHSCLASEAAAESITTSLVLTQQKPFRFILLKL